MGASDPVHLQVVGHSCCGAETSTHSSAQLCRRPEISPGAVLGGCRRARSERGFRPFQWHFSDSVHLDVESRLSADFFGSQ